MRSGSQDAGPGAVGVPTKRIGAERLAAVARPPYGCTTRAGCRRQAEVGALRTPAGREAVPVSR